MNLYNILRNTFIKVTEKLCQVCSVGLNILVRLAVQTCHLADTQLCAGGEDGKGACQV